MEDDTRTKVRKFMRMYADTNAEVREYAVNMLGMTHSALALPALENAMRDREPQVRVAAANAMINLDLPEGRHAAITALLKSPPLLELASQRIRPNIMSALSLGLKERSAEHRCDAAELVFVMDAQSAGGPLLEAIRDDALVRATFVIRIGERDAGGQKSSGVSEEMLVRYLDDREPEVRFFAVEGLRNRGKAMGEGARSAICERAGKEQDRQVLEMLAGALRDIGYPAPPVSYANDRQETRDSRITWLISRRVVRQMREGTIPPEDGMGMPKPFQKRGATPEPKRGTLPMPPRLIRRDS